jgi:hypothetical protein
MAMHHDAALIDRLFMWAGRFPTLMDRLLARITGSQ